MITYAHICSCSKYGVLTYKHTSSCSEKGVITREHIGSCKEYGVITHEHIGSCSEYGVVTPENTEHNILFWDMGFADMSVDEEGLSNLCTPSPPRPC